MNINTHIFLSICTPIIFLFTVSFVYSMEDAIVPSINDLPTEIAIYILEQGLRAQDNIYDIKKYANTFELIHKHLHSIKRTYCAHFNPTLHAPLLNHLYENTEDISKNEIALALGLDGYFHRTDVCTQGYIYLDRQLMDAISNKYLEESQKLALVKDLVENKKADINYSEWVVSKNKKGDDRVKGEQTPLGKAYKQDVVFTYLLEKGANPDQGHSTQGKTVLDKLILKIDQTVDQKGYGHSLENFYYLYTQNPQDPELIDFLVEENYAINNFHICSPTILKNIELLFQKGACLSDAYQGATYHPDIYCRCLISLINKYRPYIQNVSAISRYNQKLNSLQDWIGIYPLTQINPDVINRDINVTDYARNSALHVCINKYFNHDKAHLFQKHRYTQLLADIQLLIDYKAPMNKQDKMGDTPLHLALRYDVGELKVDNKKKRVLGTQLVQLLIKNKANLNSKNYYKDGGDTPLYLILTSSLNTMLVKLLAIQGDWNMPKVTSDPEWITDVEAIKLQKQQARN